MTTSPALLRFGVVGAPSRRLFCFPFAGGSPATFRPWARALPADVEVVAVQLPGRASRWRERPLDTIPEIVDAVRPAIEAVSDLPYALFGHSMGALVAFEMALALEDAAHDGSIGRGPSTLFVSARRAPDEREDLAPISALPDGAFLDEMQRRYGGVPDAVRREPELLAMLLPALRADVRALERYVAPNGPRLRCPVHVYGGSEDRHPAPTQLGGWQRMADGPVRVRVVPGDHFFLVDRRDDLTRDIAAHWVAPTVEVMAT